MKDKFFIDTNIFIYSVDDSEVRKCEISKGLIKRALNSGNGLISFQVVQEFINTSKKKFDYPDAFIRDFSFHFLFPLWDLYPSRDLYLSALEIQKNWLLSFYDSLIIAAALEGNCKTLYSEELQNDQKINSLVIKDPFR